MDLNGWEEREGGSVSDRGKSKKKKIRENKKRGGDPVMSLA